MSDSYNKVEDLVISRLQTGGGGAFANISVVSTPKDMSMVETLSISTRYRHKN